MIPEQRFLGMPDFSPRKWVAFILSAVLVASLLTVLTRRASDTPDALDSVPSSEESLKSMGQNAGY